MFGFSSSFTPFSLSPLALIPAFSNLIRFFLDSSFSFLHLYFVLPLPVLSSVFRSSSSLSHFSNCRHQGLLFFYIHSVSLHYCFLYLLFVLLFFLCSFSVSTSLLSTKLDQIYLLHVLSMATLKQCQSVTCYRHFPFLSKMFTFHHHFPFPACPCVYSKPHTSRHTFQTSLLLSPCPTCPRIDLTSSFSRIQ